LDPSNALKLESTFTANRNHISFYRGDVSRNGKVIFDCNRGSDTIRIYDGPEWKLRTVVSNVASNDGPMAGSLSPDGRTLAFFSQNKTIMLWNTVVGRQYLMLEPRMQDCQGVGFSPSGWYLVAYGRGINGQAEMVAWKAENPDGITIEVARRSVRSD
jgi:WD40 repeat protein